MPFPRKIKYESVDARSLIDWLNDRVLHAKEKEMEARENGDYKMLLRWNAAKIAFEDVLDKAIAVTEGRQ